MSCILEKKVDLGVLLCGTGIGMAIAANRFKHIYAGITWNKEVAQRARQEDSINILVIPADFVSVAEAKEITNAWLSTNFKQAEYAKRIAMIDNY